MTRAERVARVIVDAQVHLGRSRPGGFQPLLRPLSLAERRVRRGEPHRLPDEAHLLGEMDRAHVDAAVLVPLTAAMEQPDDDDEPCLLAARRHPRRFAVMARIDPWNASQEIFLDTWAAMPEVLGVRVTLKGADVAGSHDGEPAGTTWLWEALERRAMPVMINMPEAVGRIGAIAEAHPDLKIVVDHCGFEGMEGEELYDDLTGLLGRLLSLARFANVAVKASGLPAMVDERYPFEGLRRCLRTAIEVFGPDRIFWGSNLSRLPCPYVDVVNLFREELDFLDERERGEVLGEGIVRWLGWAELEGDGREKGTRA